MVVIPGNVTSAFKIFSQITEFELLTTFFDWKKQKVIAFDFVA